MKSQKVNINIQKLGGGKVSNRLLDINPRTEFRLDKGTQFCYNKGHSCTKGGGCPLKIVFYLETTGVDKSAETMLL